MNRHTGWLSGLRSVRKVCVKGMSVRTVCEGYVHHSVVFTVRSGDHHRREPIGEMWKDVGSSDLLPLLFTFYSFFTV